MALLSLALAVFIMSIVFVVPGVLVLVGSYLQIARRERWALALVLVGAVSVFPCVGYIAYFMFGYTADTNGLYIVYTDLLVVTFIIGVSIVNAFFNQPKFATRTS